MIGILFGTLLGVISGTVAVAETPPAAQVPSPPQPAAQAVLPASTRVFASEVGLVLNFIKPDKTADFEAVMAKLKQALQKSDKPERQQQAAGWRFYKATETGPAASVVYVFLIDPPVKGADYTVSTILAEGFPTEAQTLFKTYADAFAQGQNFVNLTTMGKEPPKPETAKPEAPKP